MYSLLPAQESCRYRSYYSGRKKPAKGTRMTAPVCLADAAVNTFWLDDGGLSMALGKVASRVVDKEPHPPASNVAEHRG